MATNNAYSDLIHLFIDGEATETERNLLFGALKDSPELQEEFSSAMQLKQAFASDIMRLQPPSYLQSKIAERAGLIVAASSSIATAPVVVNSLSNSITSAMSAAGPAAATGISKGLLTLLIGTTVGVLSTVGIIEYTKQSPKPVETVSQISENRSAIPNTATQDVTAEHSLAANPGNISAAKLNGSSTANKNSASEGENLTRMNHMTLRSAAPLPVLTLSKATLNKQSSSNGGSGKVVIAKNSSSNIAANNSIPSKSKTVDDVQNPSPAVPAAEEIAQSPAMPLIATTEPKVPVVKNIGWSAPSRNPFHSGNDGYYNEPDWMARLSFSYRGMPTYQLYQGHDDIAAAPSWNNMGVAVKYEVDPFRAFALEVGQETFPVYLSDGSGGFNAHHSIVWAGMSYTISNPLWKFLGIYPEARALLGGSTAGPIAKVSAGLVFRPFDNVGMSIDPEYTALFIKQNGSPVAGNKLGLTYSLILHF